MAGIFPMGDLALDQKKGASHLSSVAAESWLEPLLLKSDFYRKHFTRDGRRESKSTCRGSTIQEDIAVRKASIAASRQSSVAKASIWSDSDSEHPEIWVHVDAAYAGAALVCPEYSALYSHHFAHVDSFNMNMHKWPLVNFDASCLFVRDRNHLTRALSISAAYYENKQSSAGLVTDYRDWQIPLGH
ncbi:hypothetical protein DV735_g1988, partial [Chaetothyriales sp. CBS 134920]